MQHNDQAFLFMGDWWALVNGRVIGPFADRPEAHTFVCERRRQQEQETGDGILRIVASNLQPATEQ